MKVFQRFVLPFLSGLLLFAAWPMSPLTFVVFFALVPLLYLNETVKKNGRYFYILYFNFFLWNLATTWWIWNASPGGAAGAILANSLLMTIPWMLFRFTKKQLGKGWGYTSFILYWIAFEYIHHNWELSWPWLTLGNVFATSPSWVQWYQYTGTTGGSLWILIVNLMIFLRIPAFRQVPNLVIRSVSMPKRSAYAIIVLALACPVLFSFLLRSKIHSETEYKSSKDNIVVVQPNIDPYKEKFATSPADQVEKLIRLSESQVDSNTRLVVWPETAIPVSVWENELLNNAYYQPVIAFVKRHPQLQLVTGIDSYRSFGHENNGRFSMQHDEVSDNYYEMYNTAMGLDGRLQPQLYHKSKLVPGPESLPSWLSFMGKIFESLGGLSGTLGRSDSVAVFTSPQNSYQPAPVICYESIYSDYLTQYVKRGANIITIITNDGWWGNTPGYRQHMSYGRLRAIETGCWVARSANTGISCFIDTQGNVYEPQPWDTESAIKMQIPPGNPSFYSRYGDLLSRVALIAAIVLFVAAILFNLRKRFSKKG